MIVVTVSFKRVRRGDLIIGAETRDEQGIGVVGERRPMRGDHVIQLSDGERCRRLSLTWDVQADTARLRVPSRCFNGGDYGAIRVFVLTEDSPDTIGDVDLAPGRTGNEQVPWTRWIPRG